MRIPGKHTAQGIIDLGAGVDGAVPAAVGLVVPALAAAALEDRSLELGLDVGGPFAFGGFFDFVGGDFAVEDGADEVQGVVDHVFGGEDDGGVARGGVWAEEEEEVGELVHCCAHVGLGAAASGPEGVEGLGVAAGDVEGM